MSGGQLTWDKLGSFILLSCVYTVSSQTSNYIHPKKCTEEQIKKCRNRNQTDCPRPRTFYQSFDPENPCCPKYNCICTGVTDGTNRYHKDQLAYYYGNCTIIQKNVIIDGISDRWDIDEYLKDIEDVWGYVAFENNVKIDSVTFENLRIIRGQSVKKTLGERGAALFVHFNQQLSDFVAPKLTEISNGDVTLLANFNLCHIHSIDFYGEIFNNPCNPAELPPMKPTACQYVHYYINCCDYSGGKGKPIIKKKSIKGNSKETYPFPCQTKDGDIDHDKFMNEQSLKVHQAIMNDFWPQIGRKYNICSSKCEVKVDSSYYKSSLKYIPSIYQQEAGNNDVTSVRRCWNKYNCQTVTRSTCEANQDSGERKESTGITVVNRCIRTPGNQVIRQCRDCVGGCSVAPHFEKMIEYVDRDESGKTRIEQSIKKWQNGINELINFVGERVEVTCHACISYDSQLPYKNKCLELQTSKIECQQSFSMNPSADDDGAFSHRFCFNSTEFVSTSLSLKYHFHEQAECPEATFYDDDENDCVKYCTNLKFEIDQLNYLEKKKDVKRECVRCDESSKNRGSNEEPINGFRCKMNEWKKEENICYGPGNPEWKKFLLHHEEWCVEQHKSKFPLTNGTRPDTCISAFIDFENKTGQYDEHVELHSSLRKGHMEHLRNCTILDGNFVINIADIGTDKIETKKQICDYVRNIKIITGHMDIQAWPSESLDCFERLESIHGKQVYFKTISKESDESSVTTSLNPYAIVVRTDAARPEWFRIKYLGFSSLRSIYYGSLWASGLPKNPICQLQTDPTIKIDNNYSNDPILLNPIFDKYFDSNQEAISKINFNMKTYNDSIGNEECFQCNSECDGGCFGPLANHCLSCQHYNDSSAWFDENKKYRVEAVWGIYKNNATDYGPSDVNPYQWKCVKECPKQTYLRKRTCFPCHKECLFGCNGKTDSDCERNVKQDMSECRNKQLEKRCVENCRNEMLPILYYSAATKREVRYEFKGYYDKKSNNMCYPCAPECLSGCDGIYGDYKGDIRHCFGNKDSETGETIKKFEDNRCYNATSFVTGVNNSQVYYGRKCSADGILDFCTICDGQFTCNVDWEGNVTCDGAPTDWIVISSVLVAVFVLTAFICCIFIILWCKKKKEMKKKHQDDIKQVQMTMRGVDKNRLEPQAPGDDEFNISNFEKVKIIPIEELELGKELGSGNFGQVHKAIWTQIHRSESQGSDGRNESVSNDPSASLIRQASESSKTKSKVKKVKMTVAVKRLKLDHVLDTMSLARIWNGAQNIGLDLPQEFHPSKYPHNTKFMDLQIGSDVYIKYKRMFFLDHQEKLTNEASNIVGLSHIHLVKLFGITELHEAKNNDGSLQMNPSFMVVDFAENGELKSYISNNRNTINEVHIVQWLWQIAQAMSYLEAKGIVHRDLAARNILLHSTEPMHIAVSDFGLAEVVNRRKACNDKYKLDSRMPIPFRWYAPESLEKNIYNHKSDVWSFGITTWEILSLCQYSEPYKNDKDYQEFSRKYQKNNPNASEPEILRQYLLDGNIISMPTDTNGEPTCSNRFWFGCKSKYFNRDESLRQNFRQIEEEFSKIDSEKTYADYFLINRKPRNVSRTSDGNSTLPNDSSLLRHRTVTYEDPQKEMKNAFYRPPTNMTQPMYQNVANSHEVSTNGDDVFRPSDLDPRGLFPRSQTRPSQNLSYASLTDRESTASSNIMNPIYSGGHGSRFSSAVDSPRSGPTPNSRYINVNQSPEAGPDRFQFPSVHSNTVSPKTNQAPSNIFRVNNQPASPIHQRQRSRDRILNSNSLTPVRPPQVPQPLPRRNPANSSHAQSTTSSALNGSYENLLSQSQSTPIQNQYLEVQTGYHYNQSDPPDQSSTSYLEPDTYLRGHDENNS